MIRVIANDGNHVPHTTLRFSGGEVQVRLEVGPGRRLAYESGYPIVIEAGLHSSDDVMELLLVTDAVRRRLEGSSRRHPAIKLVCPYLPYARQDRVCAPGEALSLRVMCDLINSQRYDAVEVWDPHSDVSTALLDRCSVLPQSALLTGVRGIREPGVVLVAPDAGAVKKTEASAKALDVEMVVATKHRNPQTGEITGTEVFLPHRQRLSRKARLVIVDDICDGGRTFVELAKVLAPMVDELPELYVTHGIFSKGLSVFDGLIGQVYCPNVFPNVPEANLLKRI